MAASARQPEFRITTWRVRGKARLATIQDSGVLGLMQAVGKQLKGEPRMAGDGGRACLGIYALPSGHVVELYEDPSGKRLTNTALDATGSGEAQVDLAVTSGRTGDRVNERPSVGYVFANLDAWLNHASSEDL